MSAARKVLWLTKGLGRGGAEQLLVTSAAHVDPGRFQVEVAYLLPAKDALVPALTARGLPVHCLQQSSPYDLRWAARLRRLVRTGGFDLVHSHMPLPAVAARLGLGPRRPALVHTEHNMWQRYRRPTYWANALTYGRNDAVIAVSHAVAGSIDPRRTRAAVEVLHHGVEPDAVRHGTEARRLARARLGLPETAFVVGTVGNFTPKKDQATLLRALVVLRRSVPSACLVLIGTGPLRVALEQQAAALGLGDAVHFTGIRDDVPELLPGLDVFTLSSLHEGLSIALVEALASGVPAVCTRVGGIPEVLVDEGVGLLVDPGDSQALGAALARVAQEPGLQIRLGEAGRTRALAFDIRRATRRIEQIYDDVLASR